MTVLTTPRARALLPAAVLAASLALAGCGATSSEVRAGDPAVAEPAGSFEYRDARGQTVRLPTVPDVVVAQSSVAAALWDAGYQVDGVYGELTETGGALGYQAGSIDLTKVEVLGRTFGEFSVVPFQLMDPDLLIDVTMDGQSLWYVPPDQADQILGVAPSIAVPGMGYSNTDDAIGTYVELAGKLGADVRSEQLQQEEDAYQDALAEVAALAADKGDLQILVVSRDPSTLYVANPLFFPELGTLAQAGLHFVEPEGTPQSFHAVEWDEAGRYADADVVLYDARELPDVAAQLEQVPGWTGLPAVQAGQVYPWPAGTPYSYRAWAEVYRGVADWLAGAETVP